MSGMFGIDHITVQPPTEAEINRTQCDIAHNLLEELDEDWEVLKDRDRRRTIRNVMKVLENEM